jgi:ABC-type glycerol-3-phosphate transport system substrate-binding protein
MHSLFRHPGKKTVAIAVLLGTVVAAQPAATRAAKPADNIITISVFTNGGSLQGFNNDSPTAAFSIHNIYHDLLAKAFPNVRFKETYFSTSTTQQTKLTLAVNSGNPPDMVFIQGGDMGFTVLRKQAQPLDKYFAQYHTSDSFFLPGMAKWAHFGGHWYGIPAVSGPLAGQLLYLPKYMTSLGYNNGNLRTFDDLYQMSKKAVKFDSSGNLTRIGYWPGSGITGLPWQTTSTLFCTVGHGRYNAANQPTATDPCNVTFLTYLKKLTDLYGGADKLNKFISGDPNFWGGSPKDYMASGKALITFDAQAYWSITPFDQNTFGFKGGLEYNVTPLPPTTTPNNLAEVADFPSTQQLIVIPPGAKNADTAFAIAKFITWDHGTLLGPSTNGSPVSKDQDAWLAGLVKGEAAFRKSAGLAGNPSATLPGVQAQPKLARLSQAFLPTNPVETYYIEQLNIATSNVLYGKQSPADALAQVQKLVVAYEAKLKSQYGAWNW